MWLVCRPFHVSAILAAARTSCHGSRDRAPRIQRLLVGFACVPHLAGIFSRNVWTVGLALTLDTVGKEQLAQ